MRRLQQLCQDRPDALDLIDQARQRKHGGDRKSSEAVIKHDNISLDYGTGTEYALRRLRKDRPDLHQRVIMEPVFLFLSKSSIFDRNFP